MFPGEGREAAGVLVEAEGRGRGGGGGGEDEGMTICAMVE